MPGRAVGADGALTGGAKEFPDLVTLASTLFCAGSAGAGDCFALQPTVSPMPTMAAPPTHRAIRRVKGGVFIGGTLHPSGWLVVLVTVPGPPCCCDL